jgi:Recombinase
VPLGYDAKDKKLVVNNTEAEAVRYIFKRYLEVKSFGKLVGDLEKNGIVTKRRNTKVAKFNCGIAFTYGPFAHFLKTDSISARPATRTNGSPVNTPRSSIGTHSTKSSDSSRPILKVGKPVAARVTRC